LRIESAKSDKLTWLANQIFTASPQEVTGLKFYVLDCGCIHYQRVLPDGTPDTKTGIYRNAEQGPCGVCMLQDASWKNRAIDKGIFLNKDY